ncbi:MAG: SpoIIIAH-like family protein [Eubacteriales bacterium]|jgi:stage III sporulation protein AH|nr:SpoIIIAH-like family protein [Eubacteriales bacterium]
MKKFKFKLSAFGTRQVTLLALVILIAIAGYINLSHEDEISIPASVDVSENSQDTPASTENADYFAASRIERDKARSSAQEVYREVIENRESSSEAKVSAQSNLAASAKASETEALIEGVLKAKGFEDNIVYISESGANVVVKTIGLTPAQAAQIQDVVKENTGLSSDKIKIVEIK